MVKESPKYSQAGEIRKEMPVSLGVAPQVGITHAYLPRVALDNQTETFVNCNKTVDL